MKFTLNVDHVAVLRNARAEENPDPVTFALMAEIYGIDGIVVHLREDRRHINERDVRLLKEQLKTKLDLEMAAVKEIIDIAVDVQPDLVTLVPEKREELTTEGGLNVIDNIESLKDTIVQFHEAEIPVSLFVEPDLNQIDASVEIDADLIEIHTGVYANAKTEEDMFDELERIRQAAIHAKKFGLGVNAGHGLNYNNVKEFRAIKSVDEVSIGQAVIARSVFVGLEQAIREMKVLLEI
ncbi:MAG: pyridoxine 5'-phosphate synthase [Ignavibacteriae bacterium]|nr:MAG: pyridoxine 5'-phosphate synthase [Ignavibacteriota bacterium]